MDVGELINSILAEDKMEDARQYLLRGRRFEHLGIEELKQRWTGSFNFPIRLEQVGLR